MHVPTRVRVRAGLLEQVLGMLHIEEDAQVLGNCLAVMMQVRAERVCAVHVWARVCVTHLLQ